LIEHKVATIVCEENGHVSLSYNAMLTRLEANIIVKESEPIKAKGAKERQQEERLRDSFIEMVKEL